MNINASSWEAESLLAGEKGHKEASQFWLTSFRKFSSQWLQVLWVIVLNGAFHCRVCTVSIYWFRVMANESWWELTQPIGYKGKGWSDSDGGCVISGCCDSSPDRAAWQCCLLIASREASSPWRCLYTTAKWLPLQLDIWKGGWGAGAGERLLRRSRTGPCRHMAHMEPMMLSALEA